MNQTLASRDVWQKLPWKKIQVSLFKLQKRIYRASLRGNVKLVHRLQRLLSKSWYARVLAVRRVTQDNQGKRTAGIDGIKHLTPQQRMALVLKLNHPLPVTPTRRIWIDKPGCHEATVGNPNDVGTGKTSPHQTGTRTRMGGKI